MVLVARHRAAHHQEAHSEGHFALLDLVQSSIIQVVPIPLRYQQGCEMGHSANLHLLRQEVPKAPQPPGVVLQNSSGH